MQPKYDQIIPKVIKKSRYIKNSEGEEICAYQTTDAPEKPVFLFKEDLFGAASGSFKRSSLKSHSEIRELLETHVFQAPTKKENYEKMYTEVKAIYAEIREKLNKELDEAEVSLLKKIPNESAAPEFLENYENGLLLEEGPFKAAFEELLRYFGSDFHNFDTEEFLENIRNNRDKMLRTMQEEIRRLNKMFVRPKDSTILEGDDFENLMDWIGGLYPKPKMNLLYRGSVDGQKASDFHRLCDNKGPTVVLMKNQLGRRFGGYNHSSWKSDGSREESKETFVFSLDLKEKYIHGGRGSGAKATSYNSASNGFYFGSDNG